MHALLQDLRHGLRMLLGNARVTAVVVLSLGLGLGATVAIFSLVHAVLLRPLPYRDADRLTLVLESNPEKGVPETLVSPANFADFRDQNTVFESMAAFESASMALTGAGEPEQVRGLLVSGDLFTVLGARPALGRDFLPPELQPGAGDAVLVSHGFWERRFGRDPGLLGRTLTLGGRPRTVVGIMPPRFEFPDRRAEMWLPLPFSPRDLGQRGYRRLSGVGRLKPGVTLEQASAEMNHIAARLGQQYPLSNRGWRVKLAPLREKRVEEVRLALLILLGAVTLLLLIACANIAGLLLARNAAREREIAIRAALGAGRARLMRQLLAESLWLVLLGGTAGLALNPILTRVLLALSPKGVVLPEKVELSIPVLGFSLAVTLITALLCGLVPAVQASRTNLNESLKEGGRFPGAGRRQRARTFLVAAEVAVALVLLAGAGVMLRSLLRLGSVDPGFRADHLLTVRLVLPPSKYGEGGQRAAFHRELLKQVRSLPGVRSAAATNHLPMVSDFARAFTIGGRPVPPPGEWPAARFRAATPEYFRAMGIPVIQGRVFGEHDHDQAPGVAVINQTLARVHWPGANPLGQQVNLERPERTWAWRTIVGVVGDVRHTGLDAEVQPEVYAPYYQMPEASTTLVVRTALDPAGLAAAVRAALRAVDPEQPLGEVRTMERVVAESESVGARRTVLLLLGVFAMLALVLAAVGVYGVISYSVVQRAHEIGVRMAMGAQGGDVLRLMVRQALGVALVGVAIGLAAAFALTRFLSKLLYGVSAADPGTFAGVALLLLLVSLLASYVPARAATRVDPTTTLREA